MVQLAMRLISISTVRPLRCYRYKRDLCTGSSSDIDSTNTIQLLHYLWRVVVMCRTWTCPFHQTIRLVNSLPPEAAAELLSGDDLSAAGSLLLFAQRSAATRAKPDVKQQLIALH